MDWKYKHFYQERIFAAPRDIVLEAARTFIAESLGWEITDTEEGFTAQGSSFSHSAIANMAFKSAGSGTRVTVQLSVSRAGASGFMLFDVGGYYNIQIRKWLDGIQWSLYRRLTPVQADSPSPPIPANNKATACLFNGCLGFIVAIFAIYFLVTFICAVVGLITGHLYLWGRGGTIVLQGSWARIVSTLILLFGAFLAWRIKRSGNRSKANIESE